MKYNNISLIGFMASGKSTVGKLVAEKLGMLLVDIDRIIEIKQGMTVAEIFNNFGEIFFREIESEVIGKIYNNKNCVFACGGGVVERGDNIRTIRNNSWVVYLKVSPPKVMERINGSNVRPLLQVQAKQQKIEQLLEQRKQAYAQSSHLALDTDWLNPEQAAKIIINSFKKL